MATASSRVITGTERVIEAPVAAVYAVLADYAAHHPRIMPPSLFENLEVEHGGVGAGTVFHITLRLPGRPRRLHMQVAEPEPGRVLTETDLDSGAVTAFTVRPGGGAERTLVRITTEWAPADGIGGLVDRWLTPIMARCVFKRQLAELQWYMRTDSYLLHTKGLAR